MAGRVLAFARQEALISLAISRRWGNLRGKELEQPAFGDGVGMGMGQHSLLLPFS